MAAQGTLSFAASGPARAARVVRVDSAANLQAALDAAEPGDTIELIAGVTYTGNFRFPAKAADRTEFITVQSTAIGSLPAGVRVTPKVAAYMPKLVTPSADALLTFAPQSHHWRLVGLELTTGPGVYAYDVVRVGELEATTAAVQPGNIEFDRIYLHGQPDQGTKRGIFFNSNAVKLTNSYLSDFKSDFQDAMAVAACNGPGPYEITNNYLEGAGYSIIFGGCNNGIIGVVPSDVTFTRNHLFKPLTWKDRWVVKNIFEVKMGRRMRIESNVFENNWQAGQSGFGILFTVRADGVDAQGRPFSVIEDVNFSNNLILNSFSGVSILGQDDLKQNAGQASRLNFRNNLFIGVTGRLFQILQSPRNVVIEKNTALQHTAIIVSENVSMGMVMRDNIFTFGEYGILGSGIGVGNPVLQANFPDSIVQFNGFIGDGQERYPTGNTYLKTVADARFINVDKGNYRLGGSSPLRGKGQNGKDPGVDQDALEAAISGVASTLTVSTRIAPKITAVVNSLDYTSRINPGGVVAIFGTQLSDCTQTSPTLPLQTALCETQVLVGGQPAPIAFVSPDQILAQVPSNTPSERNLEFKVSNKNLDSEVFLIESPNVLAYAPAFLSYGVKDSSVIWAVAKHSDGSWNGPLGGGTPLRPGQTAALIVGGLGPTTPRIPDGNPSNPDAVAVPDARPELYINDVFQPVTRVAAIPNTIDLFEVQFTLDGSTSIGGIDENWIWVNVRGVESVRRRIQLAPGN